MAHQKIIHSNILEILTVQKEVTGDAAYTTKFSIVDGYDAKLSARCILDANCYI